MRLSLQEQQAIRKGIEQALQIAGITQPFQVYLFGSRIHDHLKGGDIDLLVVVATAAEKSRLDQIHYKILASIKGGLGDQKIDLLIACTDDLDQDPFLKSIRREMLPL